MRLLLVRHGETEANVAGRWQGQGDSPLSARGEQQARALAARLRGERIDAVVSSDLGRAARTAEALGRPVERDPRWREIDVGAWEGLDRHQVAERFPDEVKALRAGRDDVRIGGGESWQQVRERVGAAFESLRARFGPDAHVLVVAHGGVLSELLARLLGLDRARPRCLGRLSNASITVLHCDDEGRAEIAVYNDAAHAESLAPWALERLEAGGTRLLRWLANGDSVRDPSPAWVPTGGLAPGSLLDETFAPEQLALRVREALGHDVRLRPPPPGSTTHLLALAKSGRATLVDYGRAAFARDE
ncbi:MAG: histidine phosphatase family protein [Myxococcota bacterium]|nr:histidine phosphatase family protein [Myxococcota bacterium]MDW8362803.1 histidine phosphatase family protein [Myxococcales bacterium]